MSSASMPITTEGGSTVGHRCRTKRLIRTHAGNVLPSAVGMILSEIDNLGRHMLQVRWDGGVCAYVFPHEIELVTCSTNRVEASRM
jgi:hypothetical protein